MQKSCRNYYDDKTTLTYKLSKMSGKAARIPDRGSNLSASSSNILIYREVFRFTLLAKVSSFLNYIESQANKYKQASANVNNLHP